MYDSEQIDEPGDRDRDRVKSWFMSLQEKGLCTWMSENCPWGLMLETRDDDGCLRKMGDAQFLVRRPERKVSIQRYDSDEKSNAQCLSSPVCSVGTRTRCSLTVTRSTVSYVRPRAS